MANCVKVVFYDQSQPHDSQNLDLIVKEVTWENLHGLRSIRLPILAFKVSVLTSFLTFTGFAVYSLGRCPPSDFEPRECLVVYECSATPNLANRHIVFDNGQQLLGEFLDPKLNIVYMAAGDITLVSLSNMDPNYDDAQNRAQLLQVGPCAP